MCKEKLDARHMSVINLTKIQIYKIAQCSVSSNKYPSIIIFLDVRKKTFKWIQPIRWQVALFQMIFRNNVTADFYREKEINVNSSVHSDVTENDPLSTIFRTFFPLFKLVYWKRNFSTYQKRCKDMYFNQIGLLIATLQKK